MLPFIILQVASVLAIIIFLRMLLHKQLDLGYKRIQMLDQNNLKKETELNERIKHLENEYDTKISEAEHKTQAMIETAKEEIKKMREDERIKLKEESKRIIASALQQKEKVLKESEQAICNKGLDLAALIVKHMFSGEAMKGIRFKITKEMVDVLINSEQVKEALKASPRVDVISADKLTTDGEQYITEMVNNVSDGKTKLAFSVDENIVGGLIFKIDDKIIDGSLVYRINRAALEVKEEAATRTL